MFLKYYRDSTYLIQLEKGKFSTHVKSRRAHSKIFGAIDFFKIVVIIVVKGEDS